MRLALIIPDAVGIRNFLLGRFLDHWNDDVLILHEYPQQTIKKRCNGFAERAEFRPLAAFQERPVPFALRQSLAYAQMYWADTGSMRYNRNRPVRGSWRVRSVTQASKVMGKLAASEFGIRQLEKLYFAELEKFPAFQDYLRLFEQQRPDIVFSASQRSLTAVLPVLAAKALGIPTATFIVSWDNLSSKSRIAAPFDHHLVWSEHMRRELLRYYPDANPNNIHIVGTPQFEVYANPALLLNREEFFRSVGADPSRPLICYSGGDESIAPQDHEHMRVVMEIVRSGRLKQNPQVLLRPSPADCGDRFSRVRREFPELIYAPPRWEQLVPGNWAQCLPCAEDVALLANLTQHSDLNINMASTMTLDFGIHDKPVINIAFDIGPVEPHRPPLQVYYSWEHYRPVVELGAVRVARSRDELAKHMQDYLENPALDRAGRARLVDMQVSVPLAESSERIRNVLRQVVH